MGQYYTPVLKDNNGNFTAFYSHAYNNGLKLMEHSYVGNNFVNAVCNQLFKNPHNVCWQGDYVEIEEIMQSGWFATMKEAETHYYNVWGDMNNPPVCYVKPTEENQQFDWNGDYYLINHTKKVFLEIPKPKRGEWIVHPLPLLTAISNGRGGGDYRDINVERTGEWWGDLIEISDEIPQGYMQDAVEFYEE